MRIFIQTLDYNIWSTIINGPRVPTHIVENIIILKSEKDWDENDKRMAQLNAKPINVLYYALRVNEFNRIFTCSSAKDIWNRFEVTHEGTNQVKESKISMLVHKYELFKIEPNETITDMYTRFTNIFNNLKNPEKAYTNSELCRKVLHFLPRSWKAKVTAIQEAKDLTSLIFEELLGSLMTHELTLNQLDKEEMKKKKSIALKAVIQGESEESDDEDDKESEISLLAKKIGRFMRKKNLFHRKKQIGRREIEREKENEIMTCYECKKSGHIKTECLQLKKWIEKKKKTLMAT